MENLYYNGINIIDLAKRRKHQIYIVVSGHLHSLTVSNPLVCLTLPIPPLVPLHNIFIVYFGGPISFAGEIGKREGVQGLGQCELH